MLAGDSSASFVYFDLDALDPSIFGMLPSDLDGPAPSAGTPNYRQLRTHTADDACPHDALPNQTDPNPPPKGVKDRGCGTRKPDGTLGNPVQTDALGDL
jgi:hypothetical protein